MTLSALYAIMKSGKRTIPRSESDGWFGTERAAPLLRCLSDPLLVRRGDPCGKNHSTVLKKSGATMDGEEQKKKKGFGR